MLWLNNRRARSLNAHPTLSRLRRLLRLGNIRWSLRVLHTKVDSQYIIAGAIVSFAKMSQNIAFLQSLQFSWVPSDGCKQYSFIAFCIVHICIAPLWARLGNRTRQLNKQRRLIAPAMEYDESQRKLSSQSVCFCFRVSPFRWRSFGSQRTWSSQSVCSPWGFPWGW